MGVIAQIISIIAMVISVLSYQLKSNRHLFLAQGLASVLFATSYLMNGSMDSAMCNIVGIINVVFLTNEKLRKFPCFLLVIALSIASSILTYTSWWSLVLLAQLLAGVYVAWYCDGGVIRGVRFFFNSPVWIVNNIFMSFNIGGLLCEIFAMTSVAVSFIRYGKDGFTK